MKFSNEYGDSFSQDYDIVVKWGIGISVSASVQYLRIHNVHKELPLGISLKKAAENYEGLFYSRIVGIGFVKNSVFEGSMGKENGDWIGIGDGAEFNFINWLPGSRTKTVSNYTKKGKMKDKNEFKWGINKLGGYTKYLFK